MSKQSSKKSVSRSKILNNENLVIVLSAPSGAGKSTVAERILSTTSRIQRAVTHTTRAPRPGETDGEHYHFVSKKTFQAMLKRGEFVEHARVYDNLYGTSYAEIRRLLDLRRDILLVIESKGAKIVKRKFFESVFILMLPPSMEELSRRIFSRPGSEANPEEVAKRLALARKEVAAMTWYDYVVTNESIEETAQDILDIIANEKKRLKHRRELVEPFLEETLPPSEED